MGILAQEALLFWVVMDLNPHHIARLARIQLTDQEAAFLGRDLRRVLDWVNSLPELQDNPMQGAAPGTGDLRNDSSAPPTSPSDHLNQDSTLLGPASAPLRPDVVDQQASRDEILSTAPQAIQGFFVVPKVLAQP